VTRNPRTHDLVAFQAPLTQVLSLPASRVERRGLHALEALLHAVDQAEGS
jgi:hypothetical protein